MNKSSLSLLPLLWQSRLIQSPHPGARFQSPIKSARARSLSLSLSVPGLQGAVGQTCRTEGPRRRRPCCHAQVVGELSSKNADISIYSRNSTHGLARAIFLLTVRKTKRAPQACQHTRLKQKNPHRTTWMLAPSFPSTQNMQADLLGVSNIPYILFPLVSKANPRANPTPTSALLQTEERRGRA